MQRRRIGLALATLTLTACGPDIVDPISLGQGQNALQDQVPGQLLIQYHAWAGPAQKASARARGQAQRIERVADHGGELELVQIPPGLIVADAAKAIGGDPAVRFAEPNWIYTHQATSNDPYFLDGSLWGAYGDLSTPANAFGSQAAEAWAGAAGAECGTVYVGVIDEGIQFAHPDLGENVWTNSFDLPDGVDNDGNGYVDDVHGWDFTRNDNTVYDGGTKGSADQHGTHVAGTIGAVGGNALGVAGICWRVNIISAKFLGRAGGSTANAVKAVDYLADLKQRHGLKIVASNNSWGGGGFSQALLDAITRGANQGILFVAAAGNGGKDGVGDDNDKTASYPSGYNTTAGAGYDAVIAVAAIDKTGAKARFSNYGATSVDIGAPGVSIWSTLPVDKYGAYNGTSMATPHVTGAVALYAARNPVATAAQIRAAILSAAAPTPSLAGITVSGGRLDASAF